MRPLPRDGRPGKTLSDFLAKNAHAYTRAELVHVWTRRALENAVREQRVSRVLPGVYSATAHSEAPTVLGEALNLWHPAGLVTGPLALRLYGARLPVNAPVLLHVRNGARPRTPPWVTCVQGEARSASATPEGVSCAVPERALLDAWRYAPTRERRTVLWEALWARACTWRELRRELDRAPRVAERRDLERVLDWFAEGATSPLEVRAKHETFADARFSDFEWQVPVALPMRRPTLDMLHRRAMVAVELDGDAYHSTRSARDGDRERQTDLTAAGFTVIRFGWIDITQRPEWCRERLLATVAGRLARLGRR